ncbi:hypothetical protein [Methanobrevibacter woesei]
MSRLVDLEPPAAPPIRTSFSLANIISACFGNGLNGIYGFSYTHF